MSDHVKRAEEVLRKYGCNAAATEAQALEAANMLRTGLEQEAMDACEKYAKTNDGVPLSLSGCNIRDVGRRIAESRKPSERWVVVKSTAWRGSCVKDTLNWTACFTGAEAQCRAVAKALNEMEAAR